MVLFVQSGCIQARWLYSVKCFCIPVKVVEVGQKWLYLDKSGCIRVKVVVFGQKLFYSGKVVEIGQKWFYSGNVMYSVKVVVFVQICYMRTRWL